ncbi:hypothetical protein DFH09DRAFT_1399418 [Mycena vulgaris]|nr:hypothetical protein DFH09DRAFT_1399418 [Mycena vulgaris]
MSNPELEGYTHLHSISVVTDSLERNKWRIGSENIDEIGSPITHHRPVRAAATALQQTKALASSQMAFISNASHFTFEPTHKRRRREEEDSEEIKVRKCHIAEGEGADFPQVIRNKRLKLTLEIGRGPGYILHAGETKGQAVTVEVFNTGPAVRQQFESTIALSKGLMHPNVLRIEGISSAASLNHFIAYENGWGVHFHIASRKLMTYFPAHWKTAEGPLAAALKENLTRSVSRGFKMSGMNHLSVQGISLSPLGVESFDIFLNLNDRFLISFNPPTSSVGVTEDRLPEDNTIISWDVFNALCQKVLRSANRVLHNKDIERNTVVLALRPSAPHKSSAESGLTSNSASELPSAPYIPLDEEPPIQPRREYVWRTIERGHRISHDLDLKLYSVNKFVWSDGRSAHRCAGYIREEVTLAATTGDSAVISHDAPSPLEICAVCHEVVGVHEVFQSGFLATNGGPECEMDMSTGSAAWMGRFLARNMRSIRLWWMFSGKWDRVKRCHSIEVHATGDQLNRGLNQDTQPNNGRVPGGGGGVRAGFYFNTLGNVTRKREKEIEKGKRKRGFRRSKKALITPYNLEQLSNPP